MYWTFVAVQYTSPRARLHAVKLRISSPLAAGGPPGGRRVAFLLSRRPLDGLHDGRADRMRDLRIRGDAEDRSRNRLRHFDPVHPRGHDAAGVARAFAGRVEAAHVEALVLPVARDAQRRGCARL